MSQTSLGIWYKLQLQQWCFVDIPCLCLSVKARPLLAKAGLTDLKDASPTKQAVSCNAIHEEPLGSPEKNWMCICVCVCMCWEFLGLKTLPFVQMQLFPSQQR